SEYLAEAPLALACDRMPEQRRARSIACGFPGVSVMSDSLYPHLERRADGKLWLTATQTKVIEVVLDRLAHHWDADEIQRQHPHLSLGQIHSCLAYYHDHQDEMD